MELHDILVFNSFEIFLYIMLRPGIIFSCPKGMSTAR